MTNVINAHSMIFMHVFSHHYFWICRWQYFTTVTFDNSLDYSDIIEKGLQLVKVSHIPKKNEYHTPQYLFALDGNDQKYFIHNTTMKNGDLNDWKRLKKGVRLAIKPSNNINDRNEHIDNIKSIESHYVST